MALWQAGGRPQSQHDLNPNTISIPTRSQSQHDLNPNTISIEPQLPKRWATPQAMGNSASDGQGGQKVSTGVVNVFTLPRDVLDAKT
jgi:hypothetical protein